MRTVLVLTLLINRFAFHRLLQLLPPFPLCPGFPESLKPCRASESNPPLPGQMESCAHHATLVVLPGAWPVVCEPLLTGVRVLPPSAARGQLPDSQGSPFLLGEEECSGLRRGLGVGESHVAAFSSLPPPPCQSCCAAASGWAGSSAPAQSPSGPGRRGLVSTPRPMTLLQRPCARGWSCRRWVSIRVCVVCRSN